jgi:hypothetical protein
MAALRPEDYGIVLHNNLQQLLDGGASASSGGSAAFSPDGGGSSHLLLATAMSSSPSTYSMGSLEAAASGALEPAASGGSWAHYEVPHSEFVIWQELVVSAGLPVAAEAAEAEAEVASLFRCAALRERRQMPPATGCQLHACAIIHHVCASVSPHTHLPCLLATSHLPTRRRSCS